MAKIFNKKYSVSVIGCTGLVGGTLLDILEKSELPLCNFNFYASDKSAGKILNFRNEEYVIKELNDTFSPADFNFFMTENEISKKFIPQTKSNGYFIDNSSAFRLNDSVPLVIPEINFETIKHSKIIANPNCSTAICALPLYHLKKRFGIKKVVITTLQSVSGCGKNGVKCLLDEKGENTFFPYNIKETCIPKIGKESEFCYTEEELKMLNEMRKIFNDYELNITATCVRVPILNCHGASIFVECEKPIAIEEIINIFSSDDQLEVVNDLSKENYPNSIIARNSNKVYVGRIRKDIHSTSELHFYVTGDNLRRGASYNAYRIMEYLIANDRM